MSIYAKHAMLKHKMKDIKGLVDEFKKYLLLSGGTMTGDLDIGNHDILNVRCLYFPTVRISSWTPHQLHILTEVGANDVDMYVFILRCSEAILNNIKSNSETGKLESRFTNTASLTFKSYLNGQYDVARMYQDHFELIRGKLTGDLDVSTDSIGSLLIDRTTATKYRLYVDNGVLGIEVV